MMILLQMIVLSWFALPVDQVKNGTNPALNQTITLNEDLVIGEEDGDDHTLFSGNASFDLSPKGELYILDGGNHRVLHFAADGTFVTAFGAQGQGPGEFEGPVAIAVGPDGAVHVFDGIRRSMSIFDQSGSYQSSRPLPQGTVSVAAPVILKNGNIAYSAVILDANFQQVFSLDLYDDELRLLAAINRVPMAAVDWSQMSAPGFYVDYLIKQFESLGSGLPLAVATNDGLLDVQTNAYRGRMRDENGTIIREFVKEYRRIPFTEDSKEQVGQAIVDAIRASAPFGNNLTYNVLQSALARAEFPITRLPIEAIFSTENGFAVLSEYNDFNGVIECFDTQGVYQARIEYHGANGQFASSGTFIYQFGTDDDDVMRLHRYQVVGWQP